MRIDRDVIEVLERSEITLPGLRLPYQLDRKLYERCDKVLKATGWTWDRRQKAHVTTEPNAADALDSVLAVGEVITAQNMGFFETTGTALRMLCDAGDVEGKTVLEPSAGSGNVVRYCQASDAKAVIAVELQARFFGDLLALCGSQSTFCPDDFLDISKPDNPTYFDRVVMNPPFARKADIRHVLHAFEFLRPGGKLASIMSAGVMFRSDRETSAFRTKVAACNGDIQSLPSGSFKTSGTGVETALVTMWKPE